jgi:hypothetical protein
MKNQKRMDTPEELAMLRRLLEQDVPYRHLTKMSRYTAAELSVMCRAWGIKRRRGRPPKGWVPGREIGQ